MNLYRPAEQRYDTSVTGRDYRRTGASGLLLPPLSLGLWQNFGDDRAFEAQANVLRAAFDAGITHLDLANNYGPPYGAAEANFGRHLARDLRPFRDELVISTKAGYDMWPGPYGDHGSRKYLIASLNQSLERMGLEYVDIFYHHRPDPVTPLEETAGALASIVQSGKALYVGISNYDAADTERAIAVLDRLGVPLLVHQPRYSMLDRMPESGLFDVLAAHRVGAVVFSPLAQGLLTERYLDGRVPTDSRAAREHFLKSSQIDERYKGRVRGLRAIAREREQTVAQLALTWVLRRPEVTSAVIGASSAEQLQENLVAASAPAISAEDLRRIDAILA